VVVGQIEEHKCRQLEVLALVRVAGANVGGKFVHEFVGTELIGIVGVEIGIKRIEVIAQDSLGRLTPLNRGTATGRAGPGVRVADIRSSVSPGAFLFVAARFLSRRSSLLWSAAVGFSLHHSAFTNSP